MALFGLLRQLGDDKAQEAANSLARFIATKNPETAGRARIGEIQKLYDRVNDDVSKAETDYEREKREADEKRKPYEQKLALAMKAKEAGNESVYKKYAAQLLAEKDDVQREIKQEEEALAFLQEQRRTLEQAASWLAKAKHETQDSIRELERAKAAKRRAQLEAQRAEQAAGLSSRIAALDTTSVLSEATQKLNEETRALKRKTAHLSPKEAEEDPELAAFEASLKGGDEKPAAPSLDALKL